MLLLLLLLQKNKFIHSAEATSDKAIDAIGRGASPGAKTEKNREELRTRGTPRLPQGDGADGMHIGAFHPTEATGLRPAEMLPRAARPAA